MVKNNPEQDSFQIQNNIHPKRTYIKLIGKQRIALSDQALHIRIISSSSVSFGWNNRSVDWIQAAS